MRKSIKLRLTVYKPTGKYYTSNDVELPAHITSENSEGYLDFIRESCPAKITDGMMTVDKVNDNDEGFFMRVFSVNKLFGRPSLKSAVHTFLFDLMDIGDLEKDDSDEDFIKTLVELSIERNGNACPYKNYDMTCPWKKTSVCGNDLEKDCPVELKTVWFDFLSSKVGEE